jgi:hypothetical protein
MLRDAVNDGVLNCATTDGVLGVVLRFVVALLLLLARSPMDTPAGPAGPAAPAGPVMFPILVDAVEPVVVYCTIAPVAGLM